MSITAMKQALEALVATENELLGVLDSINADRMHHDGDEFHERLSMAYKAITALRTAIAEAEACEQVDWKKCLNEAKMVYSDYLDVQEALHYLEQVFLAAGAQPAPKQEFIQPGYQLVPVEPTDKMVQASLHLDLSYMPLQEGYDRAAVYKAMLAAAPVQAQPAQKQEPSYRSVPHGHCTHPKCKEVFQEYLVLSEKIAKYEPEGKSPMILNAVPKQEPDTAYNEAKRLAEWLFKTHYASEECYASGRIVWEVCDTTDGVISQIDNMVYPLVMPAPKQGWKLLKDSTLDERSWPEDYKHENGNYQNSCCECGRMFNGYKRRVMCKVCSETPAAPVQTDHIAIPGKMVQPLTFDQIEDIWTKHGLNECDCHGFARAIEQAHGIKEQS